MDGFEDVDLFNLPPSDCKIEIVLSDDVIETIPCHTRLLRLSSVLHNAASMNPTTEEQILRIALDSPEQVTVFKNMLRFFYTDSLDHVEQTHDAMHGVMKIANMYGSKICMMAVMESPMMRDFYF